MEAMNNFIDEEHIDLINEIDKLCILLNEQNIKLRNYQPRNMK